MIRLLILLFLPLNIFAQQSDILLLQKGHRTVGHFFAGSHISFYTTEHTYVSAQIDRIQEDSIFLLYYDIARLQLAAGGIVLDTIGVYPMGFDFRNIYSFPARPKKFNFITNGTLFMLGGGAYLVLNTVNTLREKDPLFGKENLPNILGATAVTALGFLLSKTQRTEYRLGKKYKLKYLPTSTAND